MTVYKLTVNLGATLAVQAQNGSFHYFKPSVGAEFTIDETDDLVVLNKRFEDLYNNVVGPNFSAIVSELLGNAKTTEIAGTTTDDDCDCDNESCVCCKPLEIGEKPNATDIDLLKKIYQEGPQKAYATDEVLNTADDLPKEEWE